MDSYKIPQLMRTFSVSVHLDNDNMDFSLPEVFYHNIAVNGDMIAYLQLK